MKKEPVSTDLIKKITDKFAAKLTPTSDLPLFSPLSKTKSGYMMRSSRLSFSLCREIFKEALGVLGCDPKVYGLHSLRSGGII